MWIRVTRILAVCSLLSPVLGMSIDRRNQLRDEVRSMFHHGYTSYMDHAYPADELRPISCAPLLRDPDPANVGVNDIHANISMTLVDSLSALLLILPEEWPAAVEKVATEVSFDQDVKIQVFELTIRAMGALLSTYQRLDALPSHPKDQGEDLGLPGVVDVKKHAPRILELATDLATRLLPAFTSPTGLPYARVNLRSGVAKGETVATCAAGAGSLVLEFTLLSRLTGDPQYEALAHRAFMAVWNRRNDHDLVGNQIEIMTGRWLPPAVSGIHAGIDSFFEYAMKAAILMDDSSYMDVFYDAFSAIQTHIRTDDGFLYRPIYMNGMKPTAPSYIDSLSAFFPGVMVLAGDIESAIRSHLVYWNIWRKYDAIPESWDASSLSVGWGGWPGRPEFIESTYYLYKATKDDFYLRVGERVMKDIVRRTITTCGFARLSNVETGALDDRMESFMLSETLKYLYLLFDTTEEAGPSNTVFTTEGHPISLPANITPPTATWLSSHRREDLYCPVYQPATMGGIPVGIEGRADYDYARALVFGAGSDGLKAETDLYLWGEGTCAVPTVPKYAIELILLPADAPLDVQLPPHDPSPSSAKVYQNEVGDWVIADIEGLRVTVRWRLDGYGYDVVYIGPHRVRSGQFVTITDRKMDGYLPAPVLDAPYSIDRVRLAINGSDEVFTDASTALFGQWFQPPPPTPSAAGWFFDEALFLTTPNDPAACGPISLLTPNPRGQPFVLLVDRGGCTFVDKALRALAAGAAGMIVVDYDSKPAGEGVVRPSAQGESEATLSKLANLAIAFVPHSAAKHAREMLATGPAHVSVHDDRGDSPRAKRREGSLLVGDHEIANMRVVDG